MYTKTGWQKRAGWPAKFSLVYPQALWKNPPHPVEGVPHPPDAKSALTSLPII